jgi:hypothetical protein
VDGRVKQYLLVLIGILFMMDARASSPAEQDVYGEEALPAYKEPEKKPETPVVVPAYPAEDKLISVDLFLREFPFMLFIDSASLTVTREGEVRYTAVLRSEAGAENVMYEAMRCAPVQYRRFAYGSRGALRPLQDPQWRYVRDRGQDRYRAALAESYFCPLPSGDRTALILRKLRRPDPARDVHE